MGQGSQAQRQGAGPSGARRPLLALPSLSSRQMKEPKQSSPALSNAPGTPCPDPPTASSERAEARAAAPARPGVPGLFLFPGVGGGGPAPDSSSGGPARQRGECGAGRGCPATVAKDIPLREPLPHSLSLQLCRGLANGKRKLGQRKRRQAPRLENPDKRRGPPAPAARPPGAWHRRPGRCPRPWQPRASPGPLPAFFLPAPCPGQLALRPLPRPPADVPCSHARGARAVRPRLCPPSGGAATPAPAASFPLAPGSAPSPGSASSPWGAGAPGGAGSRPGRRRLHSSGGSCGSAARALLGARAGTREGRGRRGGAERGGVERLFAPPPALLAGRTLCLLLG